VSLSEPRCSADQGGSFVTGYQRVVQVWIEGNYSCSVYPKCREKIVKQKGRRSYKTEHGGSYEVFNQHPILEGIISYCVGDVQYLPEFRDRFLEIQAFGGET
jgi:hypothetical protein